MFYYAGLSLSSCAVRYVKIHSTLYLQTKVAHVLKPLLAPAMIYRRKYSEFDKTVALFFSIRCHQDVGMSAKNPVVDPGNGYLTKKKEVVPPPL